MRAQTYTYSPTQRRGGPVRGLKGSGEKPFTARKTSRRINEVNTKTPSTCWQVSILQRFKTVVGRGISEQFLQNTPHLVLLSRKFYKEEMKPILAEWVIIWLISKRMRGVKNDKILAYLLKGARVTTAAFCVRSMLPLCTHDAYSWHLLLCRVWRIASWCRSSKAVSRATT